MCVEWKCIICFYNLNNNFLKLLYTNRDIMNIDLGKKVVGSNLANLLNLYWEESFQSKSVVFKFDRLEWISNNGISTILSWIKTLEDNQISVNITLQSSRDIPIDSIEYKNRKRCLERLLIQWSLKERISNPNILLDGGITINNYPPSDFSDFSSIPIIKYDTSSFDIEFDQMYDTLFSEFATKLKINLEQTEINYYDSKFLNYSILKELYSNVCLHSNSKKSKDCFFSVGINKKYSSDSSFISKSRMSELSSLEFDYFTNNKKYRNLDFVEFNFHDFGEGIVESLKEKYLGEKEEGLKFFFGTYYNRHISQNLDTRILEYSLLLFTSRYEIERQFEVHDYIPRGLYILKDIVKKYNGYFEIRSKEGAVGLSFKKGKTTINYLELKEGSFFPGTQIKIVFPSPEKDDISKSVELQKGFVSKSKPTNYYNIHFLNEFVKVESRLKSISTTTDKADFFKNKITGSLFSQFLNHFKNIKSDTIVFVDFAGVEPKTIDFFNKFVYFINHVPIAGNTRLIICNNITKGLNSTILFNSSNNLKSKGFLPYPIPCINVDTEVEWLGVEDEFSELFTQLWIGDTRKELVYDNILNYNSRLIGITQNDDKFKVIINLPSFSEILDVIEKQIQDIISIELENNGIQFYNLTDRSKLNYNDVVLSKENTVFLTSGGTYLDNYISFNEKLYILPYRRMIASYFVFKTNLHCHEKVKKLNKIISVTLSSQLIGNEVKDILNDSLESNIELIALSNYYNFQKEEKFNDIKSKDKIIVVNDIISSGSLTQNIIKSSEIKEATVVCCLSILDLREKNKDVNGVLILPLAKHSVEHKKTAPDGKNIEVINTVLNVPTSLPKKYSKENVLMEKEEFLNLINDKYLLIGNLRNNSVYFNYYLQTNLLLKEDKENGYKFLISLLSKLTALKREKNHAEMGYILKGFEQISKNITSSDLTKDFEKINKQLAKLNKKLSPDLFNDYSIDIVFYPFLSNIRIIEDNVNLFRNRQENAKIPLIFPIPRIMTSKGWRFSFPPKFLDTLIGKNEISALIIDDGSMTGDTIMQMIDSISFLSIKSIDVFSIFGRLEDFQKEFYSRIKSIQVKGNVAPINIYFGTHFNIPVNNYIENPASIEYQEIKELESSLKKYNIEMSDLFESYIISKKSTLETSDYPSSSSIQTPLFENVSKKQVFIVRDFLGRFGSYRLYSDDIPLNSFEFLINSKDSILTLLTVLNIEPILYQTIKRVFPKKKILELITIIRDNYIADSKLMNEVWKIDFFIKSLYHLNPNNFFKTEKLIQLSKRVFEYDNSNNKLSFKYFEYLLILVKLNIKNLDNAFTLKSFETNIEDFSFNLKKSDPQIFNEFRFVFTVYSQIQRNNSYDYNFPINKYYKLREYYNEAGIYENRHDDKLLTNLFIGVKKTITELKFSIEKEIINDIDKNISELKAEIIKLKENYANHNYFKFIKDIVMDLKRFSNTDLPLNIESIVGLINNFEYLLINDFNYKDASKLNEFIGVIDNYKENLLIINSPFTNFIMKSKASLLNEWSRAENSFIEQNPSAKRIKFENKSDLIVNVNPYALNLAFDNLLTNKFAYASEVPWSFETQEFDDYSELIIVQNSKFLYDKGDGTGQNSIKSILKNYGVFYKKVSDSPYTLKLTFSKN